MHMESFVRACFKNYVRDAYKDNSDMQKAIINNERTKYFLNEVVDQLTRVRVIRAKQCKYPLRQETYKWCVEDLTKTFIIGVEAEASKRVMSDAEKTRIKTQQNNMDDIQSTLDGKPSGDFADIVSGIDDRSQGMIE